MDTYKATQEEADIRLKEMQKSSYEFNRDIVLGAKNPVSLKQRCRSGGYLIPVSLTKISYTENQVFHWRMNKFCLIEEISTGLY